MFGVLCAGGRDLVGPFAVEATRDATTWIDALGGLGTIRKDAIGLGALVVVRRGPARREGRGFWLSGNWGGAHVSGMCRVTCGLVYAQKIIWSSLGYERESGSGKGGAVLNTCTGL